MPGGESGADVLDRYLPVLTDLWLRYPMTATGPPISSSSSRRFAIRLAAATLAGVDSSFVLEHHLANTEAVALAPITDGRWSCVHCAQAPPFYPEPGVHPVEDALQAADPDGCGSAGQSVAPVRHTHIRSRHSRSTANAAASRGGGSPVQCRRRLAPMVNQACRGSAAARPGTSGRRPDGVFAHVLFI